MSNTNKENCGMSENRLSISLPESDYAEVKRIASAMRVSAAWVVREAVAKYIADQTLLFPHLRSTAKPEQTK